MSPRWLAIRANSCKAIKAQRGFSGPLPCENSFQRKLKSPFANAAFPSQNWTKASFGKFLGAVPSGRLRPSLAFTVAE